MENSILIFSGVMNAILGSGLILTLKTLKSKTKEAQASARIAGHNADSVEIKNVGDLTRLLFDRTDEFEKRLDKYRKQSDQLSDELQQLKCNLNKIKHLIEQLAENSDQNVSCIAQKIKNLTNIVKN